MINFKKHQYVIELILENIDKQGNGIANIIEFLRKSDYRLWLVKKNNDAKELKFSLAFGKNPCIDNADGNYQLWDFKHLIFKHLTLNQIRLLWNLNKL